MKLYKRKSYRAKAKDFSKAKVKKNVKKPLNHQQKFFENHNMEILKKQKKLKNVKDGGIIDSETSLTSFFIPFAIFFFSRKC